MCFFIKKKPGPITVQSQIRDSEKAPSTCPGVRNEACRIIERYLSHLLTFRCRQRNFKWLKQVDFLLERVLVWYGPCMVHTCTGQPDYADSDSEYEYEYEFKLHSVIVTRSSSRPGARCPCLFCITISLLFAHQGSNCMSMTCAEPIVN